MSAKVWHSSFEFGRGDRKSLLQKHKFRNRTDTLITQDFLGLHKQWEMYINFDTWNMKSLNLLGTLKTVDRELATFRSDLLGKQEVLLVKGVTERTEYYMYLVCGKEMKIISYGQDFLYIRESDH